MPSKNLKIIKFKNSEAGVSLIITFFIMVIVLAVVMSVSIILYSEIKVIRNIGNSVVSFYAADSGVEKVLYYDSKVLPNLPDGETPVKRGLCTMLDTANANYCQEKTLGGTDNFGIFCNSPTKIDLAPPSGCNWDKCDNCQISFKTNFNGKDYFTTAKVYSSQDKSSSNLEIESKGNFSDTGRQIQVLSTAVNLQNAIQVTNACVDPRSIPQGSEITISVDNIKAKAPIDANGVVASVYDKLGNFVTDLHLQCVGEDFSSCSWTGSVILTSDPNDYYVDLDIKDTADPPNELKLQRILPKPMCFTSQ
jgi:hypothetical protein